MTVSLEGRRALLTATLGYLQLRQPPPEVAMLHQWLDSWAGIGHITVGMMRQGYDISLTSCAEGWRCCTATTSITRGWQVLSFHPTPWRAVQHAAWNMLKEDAMPST